MTSYILTVDTGGSKTLISLFNQNGDFINDVRCAGVGVSYDSKSDFSPISDALNELMDKKDFHHVKKVVINLGGTNTEEVRRVFSSYFPSARTEVFRESSGVIMSALREAEGADAILMAGTGSIALSKGKKGSIITDGWCPNIGDDGSGYWIGLEAISRSLKSLEKEESLSPLAKLITGREFPFSPVENTEELMLLRDNVRTRFMPLNRASVAKLAKHAAIFSREGDLMATEIFNDAGIALAKTVLRGIKLAGCGDNAKIFVSGGLINCIDLWGNSFNLTLKSESKNYSWYTGTSDLTKGALYYAINKL